MAKVCLRLWIPSRERNGSLGYFDHSVGNGAQTATTPLNFSAAGGSVNLESSSGGQCKLIIPKNASSVSWRSTTETIYVKGNETTDGEAVLTRGTYTVSVWIYTKNSSNVSQGLVTGTANTEFGVELYPSTTNVSFYVKLLNADGTAAEGVEAIDTKFGSRTWTKYTASVTLTTSCANFCLLAKSYGGATAEVATYFDELSIEKTSEHTTPVLAGAQISGKYEYGEGEAVSVRFLGAVDSYENYEALGFRIAYRYTGGNSEFTYRDIQSDSVYTSVLAESSGKHVAVKSINYGMKYFYATSIDGIEIKESAQYEFIITPIAIEKDTHKELVLESCRYVITAKDGTFNMSRFARVDMDTLPTDYASLNSEMNGIKE